MHQNTKRIRLSPGTPTVILLLAATLVSATAQTDETVSEDARIREQSIYIPYAKLREVFEREGRGVFLPYEEFQRLWTAAREATRRPSEDKPPVRALITEVDHRAVVTGDVVRVVAKVKFEILTAGWHEIPLRLSDAAVISAMLGDDPARLVFEPDDGGHKLIIEKKGDEPELFELSLEYAKALQKSPGQNRISFEVPQAPVSRWEIRIPESGVKVNIHPLIAATEVVVSGDADVEDYTVVRAFVGAAPIVRLDWTPKAEGAAGLEAIAEVQARQQTWIEEGAVRTRCTLTYDISRAELSQLVVEVPVDQRIVDVFNANVRQWSVEQDTDVQRITIQLFEPADTKQEVTIELEQFTVQGARQEVKIPVIKAANSSRQRGIVVVHVAKELRAEAISKTRLMQIDHAELPPALAGDPWTFSYRYVSVPFDLSLRVEKVQPRIAVDTLVEAYLEPRRLTLKVLAVYHVERTGVFKLELGVPDGFRVSSVLGRAAAGAQAADVDAYHVEDENRLVVNLARKAFGRVALAVELRRNLLEPDLLEPTGQAAIIPLKVPKQPAMSVEQESGRLVVYASESLRVNPAEVEGLRSVSFEEALKGMGSQSPQPGRTRAVLAYVFGREDAALNLQAERRQPHVTVRQLLVARIQAGVVKYEATFFYDIRYSGVKTLRIDIPIDVLDEIRNNTPRVREKVIDPPPSDLADGYVAWSLTGETEFIGNATINLSLEKKIEQLKVGKGVELQIPRFTVMNVDRAWGQIVLTKAETIDIRESGEPRGLRPIDPQHDLMAGANVPAAARAFEFHDDWELAVKATRYKLEAVKRTSIERAVLRMVVTRSGETSVQALYRLRSARQRLAVSLPEHVEFDSVPLRINGRPVALEHGDQDDYFLPLVGLDADQPIHVELRYTVTGAGTLLDYPVFPLEPAIQRVYLCAYLPAERVYLGSTGPWTDELFWRRQPTLDLQPFPRRNDRDLVNWVNQGIGATTPTTDTFQTAGRLYLFSASHPAADSRLRLFTMDEDWLNALVFMSVVLGGGALLRRKASSRWLTVGGFLVLLVLSGVFFPTFFRQVADGTLLSAIFIVMVIWMLHYVVWIRPHDPVVAARAKARQEAKLARLQEQARAQEQPAASADGDPADAASSSPPKRKQKSPRVDRKSEPPLDEKSGDREGGGGDE